MTTTAAIGWGSNHLDATPAGEANLDPAGQLAVRQTLARYAFALDHGDLVALEGVLTEAPPGRPQSPTRRRSARSSGAPRFSTSYGVRRKRRPISEGTT